MLGHHRLLRTLLGRTVSQPLLQCGQHHLGGQLGATLVGHPWDQTLKAPCHRHGLGPAGALAEAGTHGGPTPPRFLFPVRALRTVFRAKCLAAFPQAYHKEAWSFAPASAWCGSPTGFTPLLDQLSGQAWVVDAQRPGAGPSQVREDLGRSLHRIALAKHRLLEGRDDRVRFTYHHRRQGHQLQPMTLEAQECIRRFLLPLVPHGCQRLRQVGVLATRCQARALRQCRQRLGQPTEPPPRAPPSAVEWMRQRTGMDLTPGPQCGHGPLVRSPLYPLPVRAPAPEASAKVPIWDAS